MKIEKNRFPLGFGLMRLPKLADGSIDLAQVSKMVDLFMEAGGTYFDTAYVYDGGMSEAALKTCVCDRYLRERFTVATKLHAGMQCHDEESAKQQFWTSLERTGAGYIDYYLLHALQRGTYKKYDEYHLWDFVKEQKAAGRIRHWGFSFHADPELLEKLLDEHPDTEFVQLQLNYADWDNPGVAAHRNWEICRSRGIPVTVMEPVKGGILANPIPAVQDIFHTANPNASCSSWALRFAASLEGILVVLSGMSNLDQMRDNLSFMKDFKPLDEQEKAVVNQALEALMADKSIPCTACHYCAEGCPMNIPIPEIFGVVNRSKGSPEFRIKREYGIVTLGKGRASDCISCGQCESVCPQHLSVIELLESCRKLEA